MNADSIKPLKRDGLVVVGRTSYSYDLMALKIIIIIIIIIITATIFIVLSS